MALSKKQQAFINEYLKSWNATGAAIAAGYSSKTAYSIGSENLKKPEIKAAIEARVQVMTMSANEALVRLSDQARGDMSDFVTVKDGAPNIDLDKAARNGKLHLLKSFNRTDKGIRIELYDAQAAQVHILKEQHLRAGEATEIIQIIPALISALEEAGLDPVATFNRMMQKAHERIGQNGNGRERLH